MPSAGSNSLAIAMIAVAACGKFESERTIASEGGLFATVAASPAKDAWTLCLAAQPLAECGRSEAILYVYRGRDMDVAWTAPNVLTVEQTGGEIRKRPTETVQVAGQSVRIELHYTP